MVAFPFFLVLGCIIETGLMLFTEYVLQTSVQEAARAVRTGQAQTSNMDAGDVKAIVCETASVVIDCNGKVYTYLNAEATFGEVVSASRSRLVLDNVAVKSPVTGVSILKGVSLTIAPGEMVEITGASGRGKTVLAETLLGIWRRSGGTILIDGVHIGRLSDADSANAFGYVPEVPVFVTGTLAENIAHLDMVPDPARVAAAARLACLNATITALPDGYQTLIDPACALLSRGQRHQLALARALYNAPRILVIDEPDAVLMEGIPKTFDATLNQFLAQGGSVVVLARKRLALRQIGARYVIEAGRLRPLKPTLTEVQGSASVTVLANKPKPVARGQP